MVHTHAIQQVFEPALVSNGFRLSSAPDRLGWLVPSDPSLPFNNLREQYEAQGYLWLKGILNRGEVMEIRRRFFTAMLPTGIVESGTDPSVGQYSKAGDSHLGNKVLMEFVRSAAYEAFCLSKPIWQFYEALFEGDPYLHKRKLVRHNLPGDPGCTGAHYDLVYLRAGTERVATSWIPIGDTPAEMGGLTYLEGSDALGRQMEMEFNEQNSHLSYEERISAYNKSMGKTGWITKDLPGLAERANTRWLIANYEAGDMVVHSPYMVHAATTNQDALGRIRLSTDIRYQRVRDEIDVRWSNHWSLEDML